MMLVNTVFFCLLFSARRGMHLFPMTNFKEKRVSFVEYMKKAPNLQKGNY